MLLVHYRVWYHQTKWTAESLRSRSSVFIWRVGVVPVRWEAWLGEQESYLELLGKPELRSFEPEKTGVQKYPITEHQPLYFVTESFEDAKQKMM